MSAGYSGTPQAKKLGLKEGQRLCLDHQPERWTLTDPPDNMVIVLSPEPADLILSFFRAASDLSPRLHELAPRIFPAGALWIAWPRRAGGHRSDITDNVVRDYALPLGLVDVKIAALDNDWSAQRLVWRRALRSEAPPH